MNIELYNRAQPAPAPAAADCLIVCLCHYIFWLQTRARNEAYPKVPEDVIIIMEKTATSTFTFKTLLKLSRGLLRDC